MAVEISTYSDDSGIEPNQAVCVLAGFGAGPGQWIQVESQWNDVLREFGITADFKAQRFFGRGEDGARIAEYSGWSDQEADEYIDRLIGVISGNKLVPIGAAIDHDAFNSFTIGERRYLTGARLKLSNPTKWSRTGAPTTPYYCAMLISIGQCVAAFKDQDDVRINFFFDEQVKFRDHAIKTYHDLKRLVGEGDYPNADARKMGFIAFNDSEVEPKLQTADLLAHVCHGKLISKTGGSERAQVFDRIPNTGAIEFFGKSHLEAALATLGPMRPHYQQMQ